MIFKKDFKKSQFKKNPFYFLYILFFHVVTAP